ncbi:MAG: hypothetical protein ACODAD_12055, partial [Planctomycetota bacterium]
LVSCCMHLEHLRDRSASFRAYWQDMNPASNISLISAFISVYQRFSVARQGMGFWLFNTQ